MEAARLVLKLRQKNASVENKLLTVEPSMSCFYIYGRLPLPTPHSSEPFILLAIALCAVCALRRTVAWRAVPVLVAK